MSIRRRLATAELQMVRPAEAAALLRAHRATLYKWVKEGELAPPVKLGKRRHSAWRMSDLREFIERRATASA